MTMPTTPRATFSDAGPTELHYASDQAEGLKRERIERAAVASGVRVRSFGDTRVIAVTSGKGGVGKTQVSANLATLLAQRGQRVLLLDADLGLASLDLVLGVQPHSDMLSVLRGEASVEDVMIETAAGVQLLPACPGRYEMANLDGEDRERLLRVLVRVADDFDVLIIDTGAGIGSTSIGFAACADEIVLVTTPEPSALRDAYATSKVLHRRCGVARIGLVANQVDGEADGHDTFERLDAIVRRFLSLELCYLGGIPRDESVLRSVARGEPCVLAEPGSRASRALHAVLRRLLPELLPPTRPVC